MKCNNCGKNMNLRRFVDGNFTRPERWVYECQDCGILGNPKPNINFRAEISKRRNKIIDDLIDLGIKIDSSKGTEIVDMLYRQPNYFLILSIISRREVKVLTKEFLDDFLKFENSNSVGGNP